MGDNFEGVTLLVKSRKINMDGADLTHVSFLISEDQVVYTETDLTNGNIIWAQVSLENYMLDFKNSWYNDSELILYTGSRMTIS
jgi:hypothetical protein